MYAVILALLQAAAPDAQPTFSVVSASEERHTGQVVGLAADSKLTVATSAGEAPVADLVSLHRIDVPTPSFPSGPQVITTTGDRIPGRLAEGGDSRFVRFNPAVLKTKLKEPWRVPLSSIAVVWLTDTPADTPADPGRYEWSMGVRNRDTLRYRNGDTSRGTLAGLDPEAAHPTFSFRPESGAARNVRADELAAATLNPSLARNRKPRGPYAHVVLTDATRLNLVNAAIASRILTGETLFGQKVAIPLELVLSLEVLQGKATYLSDMKPTKVEQAGFLGVTWPWQADRNVRQEPLGRSTPGGETVHDKGLGTHPRTVLTYDLGGKYRRFESIVAIDPGAAVRGLASVRIVLDGKEQEINGLSSLAAGKSIPVNVNVRGAKELTLVIDFGAAGDVGADVNWCDARLIE
jgi:hypothetical protein